MKSLIDYVTNKFILKVTLIQCMVKHDFSFSIILVDWHEFGCTVVLSNHRHGVLQSRSEGSKEVYLKN